MKTVQHFLCLACLVAATLPVQASTPKVDSLLQVLQSNPPNRAEVLWGIAYELFDVDNVQAVSYAERAYQEVWKRGDSLQIVKVGTTYGQLLRRVDRIEESIDVSSRMLGIARRNDFRKYIKMLLNSFGTIYAFTGSYKQALEYHLESLDIRRLDGNNGEIQTSLHSIGLVYYKIGDPVLAMNYLKRALKLNLKEGPDSDDNLMANIGLCFLELHEFDSAKKYLQVALVLSKSETVTLSATVGMGQVLVKHGDYSNAKVQLSKSLEQSKKLGSRRFQAMSLIFLANASIQQSKLNEADLYLKQAFQCYDFKDPTLKIEYLKQMSRLAYSMGSVDRAYKLLIRYIGLKDSLNFSDELSALRGRQAAYDEKQHVARIDDQNRILVLNTNLISKQRWLIFLSVVVAVLFAVLALVLFQANKIKAKINRLLDERVRERTVELSRHRDALQHAHDEQNIGRTKVSEEIISAVASLKGLFHVGEMEIPPAYLPYIEQARLTTDKIESAINRYRSNHGRNL